MDTKLKSNKTAISIIIIMTILIASIGMVLVYPNIKKDSDKFSYNVYEENYNLIDSIEKSIYSLYYKLYDENNNKIRPSELMLELKPGVDSTYTEDKMVARDSFDEDIDQNNEYINSNLRNLEYCVLDKENKLVKQNMNLALNSLDGDKSNSLKEKLKNEYSFYMILDFDDKGNMKIEDIYGVNKNKIEHQLSIGSENNLFDYDVDSNYNLKPIKNMKYVYAIPKNLKYIDDISNSEQRAKDYSYTKASYLFINIAITFVILVAIIIPYKELKEIKIFKKIFNIPIEILLIVIYLTYIYIYCESNQLIIKTVNNDSIIKFTQLQVSQDFSNIVNYLLNVAYWSVLFSIVFISIVLLKHILKSNTKKYLKENSLIYKISNSIINKLKDAYNIEIGRENNKKLITILLINLIVVGLICATWFFGLVLLLPIYTICLYMIIKKKYSIINKDYKKLLNITKDIANGNLNTNLEEDLGTFNLLKNEIGNIQIGFKKAVDEEVKSQKMKTELISNVSHDLKTPLTSIITYVDLLKDENLSDEKRKLYIDTLDRKSERLRVLIDDLFEVSKANSGNVSLNIVDVDIVSLMKQTLLEVEDKMKSSNLTLRNNFPDEKVILKLDSQRMFRVFENLLINITKYAMPNSRVYIDIIDKTNKVEISFKNMTAEEITFNVNELVERFVRGDKARNTEGSGLGLAIAKSFVELQGGSIDVSIDGDLFKVVIVLKK
ncbi:sensor histidine kinase [Paeniclostridium sp. NSJ-45]|uniref:histidine kinase n=1 Tax=Paeniclostridium hominis TaxID=2764329 RepID=A0ABR7K2Y5_9FIRM|nr:MULTISPECIES: sensor histidine kinase [Paeniclostridium]MBC6003450.1 sensor histidine kinase [Paeniclostridium hominis]